MDAARCKAVYQQKTLTTATEPTEKKTVVLDEVWRTTADQLKNGEYTVLEGFAHDGKVSANLN